MYNHIPQGYSCPFCNFVKGKEDEWTTKEDIVYQNENVLAVISARWWINNPGHVIVVPKKHYENIYDIPEDLLGKVYAVGKKIAIALKEAYKCDGTSMRQHNEPAGNQDVFHFHVHVFARYKDDKLYQNHDKKRFAGASERKPYAEKLKAYFNNH